MKDLFLPYQQSLELKELGFSERCFGGFDYLTENKEPEFKLSLFTVNNDPQWYENRKLLPAPLYQQVFDWFRIKHNLHYTISVSDMNGYFYSVRTLNFRNNKSHKVICTSNDFANYKEVRQACLEKLINIMKDKQNKKLKIVYTEEYVLVIDEETEIKPNDLFLYRNYKVLLCTGVNNTFILTDNKKPKHSSFGQPSQLCKKIIAYYPRIEEAKELDLPLLPNPLEGDNIESIALKAYYIDSFDTLEIPGFEDTKNCVEGFIKGYKAAQQSNKQYSLEDMKKAFEYYAFTPISNQPYNDSELEEQFQEFIQSLSTQQLPKEFILGEGRTIEEQIKNGYYE